jgi:hypothetical protein
MNRRALEHLSLTNVATRGDKKAVDSAARRLRNGSE